MFLLTLLVAGNETTRSLLSGAVVALHDHPDQRAVLAADPELSANVFGGVSPLGDPGAGVLPDGYRGRGIGATRSPGRLRLHALRVGQSVTNVSSVPTRQASTYDGRPTPCTLRSASASTCASAPAWPGWRAGSSSRSCWCASRTTS